MKTNKFDELGWYKNALQMQLKPCPFCGEQKKLKILIPIFGNEMIRCVTCDAKIERALGCDVVSAWNTRNEPK